MFDPELGLRYMGDELSTVGKDFSGRIGANPTMGLDMSAVPSAESYISSAAGTGNLNKGMTAPAQQMLGAGIGAAAQIGTTLATGYMQSKQNEKYRKEDRELAEQTRQDTLKQKKVELNLQVKAVEQKEKSFNLQKMEQNASLKHNMFLQTFKKALEGRQNLIKAVQTINGDANKSADINNVLLNSFKRNK